jgi:hypothetical protein
MKNNTILLSFLLLLSCCSFSISYAQKISMGLKSGINFSTMSNYKNTDIETVKPLQAYHVGIGTNFTISKYFSLQTELNYLQLGVDLSAFKADDFSFKLKRTYQYLQLPIALRFTKKVNKFRAFSFGGVYFGLPLSGVDATESYDLMQTRRFDDRKEEKALNAKEDIKPIDFGGFVGAGMGYQIAFGYLSLDLRYQWGFTRVLGNSYVTPYTTANLDDFKHRNLMLSLGYFIEF